ncbi:hypothetical protein [Streptomyces sp. TRM68367]|uniref:hypothetical protein n=1 Tax=Streptomyces sp. TRM68367 TaxID=2758415 RepID=UPI00165CCDD8|nr:hypothetical protein [Streptomyces sp. TRM68367]MBC9725793.1 hypothetical protein [Streptomyces sp. TRM68367]
MVPRPAARSARRLACALAAGALLPTAACSNSDRAGGGSGGTDVRASSVVRGSPTASGGTLTGAGAKTALIDETDLEGDWNEVKDAATWRDSLLIGRVDVADFLTGKAAAADCQRLLDALYDDDLLGKPSGPSALTGFSDGGQARMFYQVAAYDRSSLDKSLDWMKSLPVNCDSFTVTDKDGGNERTVQVIENSLPHAGDARQGLRVTMKGDTDGMPATLTLDVAAVRVGSDAITLTNGGLDGASHDSTEQAVTLGTQRLKDVLAGRTPAEQPPGQQD